MKLGLVKLSTMVFLGLVAAGCASNRVHKGAVIDPQLLSSVQPGVDNKDSVQKTLGTPTFSGEFTPNDWYYVSRDTRAFAFRNPRVTDQTVLHVKFDAAGNVAAVNHTDETLIANIRPSKDRTATLGREKSFFEELFNNIGTISQPGLPGSQRQ